MLDSIRLENFQSHKDTLIEFSPHVNVITGPSSNGKSSIMRGVRWVMENRPSGAGFVSYWNRDKKGNPVDFTRVTMEKNGVKISRFKDADSNGYSVGENVFGAMGTDVPDLVGSTLQLTELNVQKQLDPHFLLSLSAGDVAKYLNGLVNLSLIDEVMSKADSDIRKNKADILTAETAKDKAVKDLVGLSWVEKAEKLLATYDKYSKEYDELGGKKDKLQAILSERKIAMAKQQKYNSVIEVAEPLLAKVAKADADSVIIMQDKLALHYLVRDAKVANNGLRYQGILDKSVELLASYSKLDGLIVASKSKFGELGGLIAEHKAISGVKVSSSLLDTATRLIEAYSKDVLEWSNVRTKKRDMSILVRDYYSEKESMRLSLDKLIEAEALMPEVCPTCGRPM